MKLHYFWRSINGDLSPDCTSRKIGHDDHVGPLSCLLTDDGGQPLSDVIPWLAEGLKLINSVKQSDIEVADWSRDAWGAELTKDYVKVYSLHDENYFETLSINSFETALKAWSEFIQKEPSTDSTQEIEI
ncbi:DUF5376 family protein [Pseudomonas viridiflava]|uniref:DUF5376 family protein n=1 Tax=Pseudomonas viridiflava TaxID=33069 RepID=UPI0013CE9104|nr:DUF5376 family protein [Pseudomonas viridiflava]